MFLQNALLIRQHKLAIKSEVFYNRQQDLFRKSPISLARGNENQALPKRRRDDPIIIDI